MSFGELFDTKVQKLKIVLHESWLLLHMMPVLTISWMERNLIRKENYKRLPWCVNHYVALSLIINEQDLPSVVKSEIIDIIH